MDSIGPVRINGTVRRVIFGTRGEKTKAAGDLKSGDSSPGLSTGVSRGCTIFI